jgi:hypothetical protein
MASPGKARGWPERRFSRRDALCASALRGPANAEAFHFHPMPRQEAGCPTGHMPRSSRCLPIRACGARPSRRGDRKRGGLAGEGPEMTRKAVFSEGRTLCVRIARLHECRGIPFAADGLTMSRWPRGHMPRSSQCLPIRACGPRPSARAGPARMALQGKLGDDAKGGFLGGTHSVRPLCEAPRMPRHCIPAGCVHDRPSTKTGQCWG